MRSVAKIIILNEHNEVLLLKRAEKQITQRSPWSWDLPGGHIEHEEVPPSAAVRETREETGLRIGSLQHVGNDSNAGKYTYFYTSRDYQGNISLSHEHEDYMWVPQSEVLRFDDAVGSMYMRMILKALSYRE